MDPTRNLTLSLHCRSAYARREEGGRQRARQGRVLPLFTIVRFGNTACDADVTARNGTCYTAAECASKGGTSSGTCASGFGVCCTFDGEREEAFVLTRSFVQEVSYT